MNNFKENIRSERTCKESGKKKKKIIQQRKVHLGDSENPRESKISRRKVRLGFDTACRVPR